MAAASPASHELDIEVLQGCGTKRAAALRKYGIFTVPQLAAYSGPLPTTLKRLQVQAQTLASLARPSPSETSAPGSELDSPSTTLHTWYRRTAHRFGSGDGGKSTSAVRGMVQELRVLPSGPALRVVWYRAGQWRAELISPLLLWTVHTAWQRGYFVSDDSDPEESQILHQTPELDYRGRPLGLPRFALRLEDTDAGQDWWHGLSPTDRTRLEWMQAEMDVAHQVWSRE